MILGFTLLAATLALVLSWLLATGILDPGPPDSYIIYYYYIIITLLYDYSLHYFISYMMQVHLPGLKPPGNSTSPDCPPQQQDCRDQQRNFLLPQQLQHHLNQQQQFLRCLCHAKPQASFARMGSHVLVPPKYATVLRTVLDTSWERAVRMRTIVLLAAGRGSSIPHRSWSPSLQDRRSP